MRTFVFILSLLFALNLSSCATRDVTGSASLTVIKTPPRHCKVVKVKGKRYFFWNGNHYKKTRRGYVVVRV